MRLAITIAVALTFAVPSFAADRTQTIQALMDAQGLTQMFEDQRQLSRQRSSELAKQMLDQIMTLITMNPAVDSQIRAAVAEFMDTMQAPWTSQDIVDVWAAAYASQFTDAELEQLLTFYTSPLGQKDASASRIAMPVISKHFADLSKPLLDKAMHAYIERLQTIIKDCNCKKG